VTLGKQPGLPVEPLPGVDSLAGLRVLMVGEHTNHRNVLQHHLWGWQMRTGLAATGAEALEVLRRAVAAGDPYDLVVIDFQMPSPGGLMLASAIRADTTFAKVRLVPLTFLGQRLTAEEMHSHDLSVCLFKPVRQGELVKALMGAMSAQPRLPKRPLSVQTTRPVAPSPICERGPRLLLAEDNPVNQ
jgi:CheY-like chemotaxis protein